MGTRDPELLTKRQAADILNIGLTTLNRLIDGGELPIVNLGSIRGKGERSIVRIERTELDAFRADRRRQGGVEPGVSA